MTAADGILLIIGAGIVAYAVFGGADFGGGIWDLFARGPRADRQRHLIAATMGPVWEANHVWLVFVLIGLFSGFPLAFGQLSRTLAVPLAVALVGIVLRGAAFVFRQYGASEPGPPVRGTVAWGRIFAIASVIAPASLGACVGAVVTGRLGGWFPVTAGALALACCGYLAAVFLCQEAVTRGEADLAEDFRRRAIAAAVVAGGLALLALPVLNLDAAAVAERLVLRAPLLIAGSAAGGVASIAALYRRRYLLARALAATAVVSVLAGWAVAQYPVLMPGLTVDAAAAPAATLPVTLGILIAGFAVTIPSMVLMFRIFARPPGRATGSGRAVGAAAHGAGRGRAG